MLVTSWAQHRSWHLGVETSGVRSTPHSAQDAHPRVFQPQMSVVLKLRSLGLHINTDETFLLSKHALWMAQNPGTCFTKRTIIGHIFSGISQSAAEMCPPAPKTALCKRHAPQSCITHFGSNKHLPGQCVCLTLRAAPRVDRWGNRGTWGDEGLSLIPT